MLAPSHQGILYLSMFSLAIQTVYYGPTVLGDKNPTSGYGAAASTSSEHNDPCKSCIVDQSQICVATV